MSALPEASEPQPIYIYISIYIDIMENNLKSEYYQNYKGPSLTLAQLWKKGEEKEDITGNIKRFYGENNNWNEKLYTYGQVFPNKDKLHNFYIEFHSENRKKHWFYGSIGEEDQIFNIPLWTPINQL